MNPQSPSTATAVLQTTNQTIQNSWKLFTMSWTLLWKQTLFPFITLIVSVGSALAFSLFVYRLGVIQAILAHTHAVGNTHNFTTDDIGPEQTRNIFVVLGTLLGYVILMHLFNFFMKVALSASTHAQLAQGTNGFGSGIAAIFQHFFTILGWLFISGGVGFVLGFRSSSNNASGIEDVATNVTQGFFDSAWKIITFLTVPVIVAEHLGPINAIKRSSQLVRDTWGRQLIGRYGIDAVMGSITGAAILAILGVGGGLTFLTKSVSIGIITALVFIGVLIGIGTLRNALVVVYQTVLYRYANKQSIPGYAPDAFQNVFAPKQG